jgi:hypothetical protein
VKSSFSSQDFFSFADTNKRGKASFYIKNTFDCRGGAHECFQKVHKFNVYGIGAYWVQ